MNIPRSKIPRPERDILQRVSDLVCAEWNVTLEHLRLRVRPRNISDPRLALQYLAYAGRKVRVEAIAGWIDRDHSNVFHAYRAVRDRMDVESEYRAKMERLDALLNEQS